MKALRSLFAACCFSLLLAACEKDPNGINSIVFALNGVELNESTPIELSLNSTQTATLEVKCDKETGVKIFRKIDNETEENISNTENVSIRGTTYGSQFSQYLQIQIDLNETEFAIGQTIEYTVQINTLKFGDMRKSMTVEVIP